MAYNTKLQFPTNSVQNEQKGKENSANINNTFCSKTKNFMLPKIMSILPTIIIKKEFASSTSKIINQSRTPTLIKFFCRGIS
jgi:hypothetical protein